MVATEPSTIDSASNARVKVLEQTFIFSGLDKSELDELSRVAIKRSLKPKEFLFLEGHPVDNLFIITRGEIKTVRYSSSGKEFILVFRKPYDVIGAGSILQGSPYITSAQAVTYMEILQISREHLLPFFSRNRQLVMKTIDILMKQISEYKIRLNDMATERAKLRIARILLILHASFGNTLPFTRQDIAGIAGVTTETAARVVKHFQDEGLVQSLRHKIIVTDAEKLMLLGEESLRA